MTSAKFIILEVSEGAAIKILFQISQKKDIYVLFYVILSLRSACG